MIKIGEHRVYVSGQEGHLRGSRRRFRLQAELRRKNKMYSISGVRWERVFERQSSWSDARRQVVLTRDRREGTKTSMLK